MGGKVGVLVEVNCETDFVARTDEFKALRARRRHARSPRRARVVSARTCPQEAVAAGEGDLQGAGPETGKPEKVLAKIAEGKLKKCTSRSCLLDQPFVKEPEKTIDNLRRELVAKIGENIEVRRFARFKLGEDLAK